MLGGGGSSTPQETTTTSQPWSQQIPYLLQGFSGAQNLYQGTGPQYYQGDTYAGITPDQTQAIGGVSGAAGTNMGTGGIDNSALGFATGQLNGDYLNSNPAMGMFSGFGSSAPANELSAFAGNPNIGVSGNPATGALNQYASGSEAGAGNPYSAGEAQSVLSSVVPSIESQFIAGGDLSSPEAAYATSSGATSALAPTMFQNFQQEQQNQLSAANTLGTNYLTGAGLSEGAAGTLGNENLTAASGLGSDYGTAMQQAVASLGLAPTAQSMPYTDLSDLYGAGSAQQTNAQNQTNANVNEWNYNQTLPYQMLNQYLGEISGNYGGTVTEPYFSNSGTNSLAGGLLGASLGSSILGSSGLGLTSSPVGAGLGGLAGLLAL